jgi:CRISPR-associated protein Cst1
VTEVSLDDLKDAIERLKKVFLSDPAFGIGVERSFVKGPLSQIFPNSKLVNPSIKEPQKEYEKLLDALFSKIKAMNVGDTTCPVCGWRFDEGEDVKADKFPLLRGVSNFYPGLSDGMEICYLCALSIQFFPLSVLRTGGRVPFWFVHTQNSRLAAIISRRFGWEHFERLIMSRQTLDFYRSWNTAGEGGVILLFYCSST